MDRHINIKQIFVQHFIQVILFRSQHFLVCLLGVEQLYGNIAFRRDKCMGCLLKYGHCNIKLSRAVAPDVVLMRFDQAIPVVFQISSELIHIGLVFFPSIQGVVLEIQKQLAPPTK